jgi:H+/Cl- antiporter ClcA
MAGGCPDSRSAVNFAHRTNREGRNACSTPDPVALLRSRSYAGLLVLAAILGVPISAAAYGFLALVSSLQEWLFTDLPKALGFGGAPPWWPLPLLVLAGVLVGLTIRHLPGKGGALGPLIANSDDYSVAALLLLVACKGLAYSASLAGFRGGPVFPAMFLGAAGGVAMSHLPGLPLVPGVAMGIGAMCVVMLRLQLASVLLATLLLLSDGLAVMPLVIVAVAVAYAASARLTPAPAETPAAVPPAEGPVQASRTPAQRTVPRERGR